MSIQDRLRGKYDVPVNDGAGLLDGKDTFTRQFPTPPIQHEAADRIDELEAELKRAAEALRDAAEQVAGWGGYASEYFQEKWDLQGDVTKLKEAADAIDKATTDANC